MTIYVLQLPEHTITQQEDDYAYASRTSCSTNFSNSSCSECSAKLCLWGAS